MGKLSSYIKNREPAAVAGFLLALVQGVYMIAAQFGRSFTIEQWSSITAVLTLIVAFVVRGNVTSNASLAAVKPSIAPTTPPAAPAA